MRCMTTLLLSLIALAALPLVGAHAQNQSQMNIAAYNDFQKADARLNTVYRRVRAGLDATGRRKLEKAERAWIAYRDAQADLEADVSRGGSMEPMLYSGVQAQLTKARIKALLSYQADTQGH